MTSSNLRSFAVATLLAGLFMAGCAASQAPPTWDGLAHRPTKGIDAVYVRPDADFTRYRSIKIDPVEVAFADTWNPNQGERGTRSLSASDIQAIREDMAGTFRKLFADELVKGGYALTEQPGEDTLRVSAGLANVYIAAPARTTYGPSRTYTVQPGEMTLVMELRDSVSNELLARVVDKKSGVDTGFLQVTSPGTNRADFNLAVTGWAKRLRSGLDAVNGRTP